MNQNLRALRHWLACGLAALGISQAWAQMPVPLLDAPAPTAAAQQLEALLQCKAGTLFKTDEVESRLQAGGLAKPIQSRGRVRSNSRSEPCSTSRTP